MQSDRFAREIVAILALSYAARLRLLMRKSVGAETLSSQSEPMKYIPDTHQSPVVRTDFSNPAAWDEISAAIRKPVGDFRAYVDFVSDPAYDGISSEQLLTLIPHGYTHTFLFVVDQITLSQPDRPILVIDLYTEPGRTFRVIPSEMWGVENNLSLANMDFEEFAEAVDADGIFRGFATR